MSRIAYCPACSTQEHGVKTRIALEHTCGLERGEINPDIPVTKRKTWAERLAEEQAKQGTEKPMSNNTQLPAEALDIIIQQSKEYAKKLQWPSTWSTDRRDGAKEDAANDWQAGATEYATKLHMEQEDNKINIDEIKNLSTALRGKDAKLHQAEQEIKELKQWKSEATELLNPILEYGQSKEAGIPLGQSITDTVLERCKQFDAARALLEKFISRHESDTMSWEFINEIKTFLDGK